MVDKLNAITQPWFADWPTWAIVLLCTVAITGWFLGGVWAGVQVLEAITNPRCRPGHPRGLHGEVIYGLGGMGGASLCLRCGHETYNRIWPRESIREVNAPDDWPIIEEARKRGLENK